MAAHDLLVFLPVFLALDLLIPFLLAPFYKGYSHLKQAMSVLGNAKAHLHLVYQIWLVLLGIVLLAGAGPLSFRIGRTSRILSVLFCAVLSLYALGGCILSGFFSVGETKHMTDLSSKIHGFGSAIGFLLLLWAPLFIGLYFLKHFNGSFAFFSFLCFVFAVTFFILFIMADKPIYQGTAVAWEGLWQRLSLLCMYLPIALLCCPAPPSV